MRYILAVLMTILTSHVLASDIDATEKGVEEVQAHHKVWGVLAYSTEETARGIGAVIHGVWLNQLDRERAQDAAMQECEKSKMGSTCTIVAFPGCFYAITGRAPGDEPGKVKVIFAVRAGINAHTVLLRYCERNKYFCSPPIGGCNYVDAASKNQYVADAYPLSTEVEILVSSKFVGRPSN
ncbi:MAG TPA: hypothetical protein VNM40_02415 [Candidatus Paceibacterota bacterium]|nr:hypothetical protein [Candidatus Paceibacterota bacterium]